MFKLNAGWKYSVIYFAFCLVFLWVATPLSRAQNTINVPADQPTVQAAIDAAANGDTVLVAPGTYTENIDFKGKAIILTSSGGPAVTILDGGAHGIVVTFKTSETAQAQLSGFTIRNGFQNGGYGAGILIYGASPTISGNVITGNHAAVGIGIYVNNGSPLIKGNTITGNDQTGAGTGGAGGGGILVAGSSNTPGNPQITSNTITHNSVGNGGNGGGISVTYYSSPLIQGNLIQGNTAYNGGGGISLQSYNSPIVVQNVIVNNSSLGGGRGAGMYVSPDNQPQTILNNTVAGNTSFDTTAGIYVTGFGQYATFTNNIISVNGSGQVAVTCDSTYSKVSPVFSHDDAFSTSGQPWAGICDTTSNTGNLAVDPLFAGLTDFHLQSNSPVMDIGDNSASNLPQTDFEGNTRIWDGNNDCVSTIDLGAYEFTNLAAASIFPNNFTFPPQQTNTTSAPQSATATSLLSTCWQYARIQVVGPFVQTNNCPTLGIPAGTSCTFNFAFAPTSSDVGLFHGFFQADSITGTSLYVDLWGTGFLAAPVASLSPTSLAFSPQIVGSSSATQAVTLTDTGNGALVLTAISATGDFAQQNNCPVSLNPAASCVINVVFLPSSYGLRTGALSIADNASGSPQSISLRGTGLDFSLKVSPATAKIPRGASFKFSVKVSPQGGAFSNSVVLSCSELPVYSSCTFAPVQVRPGSSGASSTMTVTTDRSRTPVGSYTFAVTGVSGALAHITHGQLIVERR